MLCRLCIIPYILYGILYALLIILFPHAFSAQMYYSCDVNSFRVTVKWTTLAPSPTVRTVTVVRIIYNHFFPQSLKKTTSLSSLTGVFSRSSKHKKDKDGKETGVWTTAFLTGLYTQTLLRTHSVDLVKFFHQLHFMMKCVDKCSIYVISFCTAIIIITTCNRCAIFCNVIMIFVFTYYCPHRSNIGPSFHHPCCVKYGVCLC